MPYHQKSIIYFQKQQSPYQVNLAVCSTLTYHCTPLLKIIFNCRIFCKNGEEKPSTLNQLLPPLTGYLHSSFLPAQTDCKSLRLSSLCYTESYYGAHGCFPWQHLGAAVNKKIIEKFKFDYKSIVFMMDSFAVISFKESEEFYILQAEFIIFD